MKIRSTPCRINGNLAASLTGFLLAALLLTGLLGAAPASAPKAGVSAKAVDLRNLGFAQLENESPEKAEATFRNLLEVEANDPLGHANLAIALLRQQKNDGALMQIDLALKKAPGRGDLLAIRADILQWSGQTEAAMEAYEQAAAASPDDPEILYGLYRHASTLETEAAEKALDRAVQRLAELRPENVLVLLARGQRAIRAGDRTAATGAFLRLRELLWQAPPVATKAMERVLSALEGPDVTQARVPALRLENVLKITPMYRESLRELSTGIQGIPVERFIGEPPRRGFGKPAAVRFIGNRLAAEQTLGKALAVGDFDGDDEADLLRLIPGEGGDAGLELRLTSKQGVPKVWKVPAGLEGLTAFDLNNDGHLDALAFGPSGLAFWRGDGSGTLTAAPEVLGDAGVSEKAHGATAVAAVDFDIEGDLDLALGLPGGAAGLLRNNLEGALTPVGEKVLPRLSGGAIHDVTVSDLDRDGDLDLIIARESGLTWLDNLRQGRFVDRSKAANLGAGASPGTVRAATAGDLNNDGWPDLIVAGDGIRLLYNLGGRFESLPQPIDRGRFEALVAFDADNDGRLDLAAAGPDGVRILGQRDGGTFESITVQGGPSTGLGLRAADLDTDGDLDLAVAGPEGLHRLINEGGNANAWVALRLRGLDKGNSKNNLLGLGSLVEVRAGDAYQMREVAGDVVHFGLGQLRRTYLMRVVWTNGVPQHRLQVQGNQRVVEEQILKGSCPFLYAWDGDRMAFVTDLLWGAPLGLPVAPGVWATADPGELVRIDGARARDGRYEMRITEELWEAAFFDTARLWLVDHPEDVEAASNLRILLRQRLPEEIRATRGLRPVAAAWDGRGRDVTERVQIRDEVYADGFEASPYQGIARRPWSFTFDLGEAPGTAVRLHLDGWIFPADASLNLAVAQRDDLRWQPPRLEVETDAGWRELLPEMGFPAGKTKTMVIDTPELPPSARRLRIVTTQWLSWDRIAWAPATGRVDSEARVVAQLTPDVADLRYRGFSQLERRAPNAPHSFDYHTVRRDSPWLPFPGRYTRYGDVRELLETVDDRSVILAPGDEIALVFDAGDIPPPAPGWTRTIFLESHGWDKDADRNTHEALQLEPLPFRAMSGYPYGPDESFPETPELLRYRSEWLTREIKAPMPVPLPDSHPEGMIGR